MEKSIVEGTGGGDQEWLIEKSWLYAAIEDCGGFKSFGAEDTSQLSGSASTDHTELTKEGWWD